MESAFNRIIRKTGRKPVSCKCQTCKSQCMRAPCLGLPEDIEKLIDAGYGERIFDTIWASGMVMGVTQEPIRMFQALQTPSGCTFFKDGLCELHSAGLKPTEGKLSYHVNKEDNYTAKKHLSWNIAKEWINPENAEIINRIEAKISAIHSKS